MYCTWYISKWIDIETDWIELHACESKSSRVESNRIITFVSVPSSSLCHICCYEGPMYNLQWKALPDGIRLIDHWAVRDRESSHYPQLSSIDRLVTRTLNTTTMTGRSALEICCNWRTDPLRWYWTVLSN